MKKVSYKIIIDKKKCFYIYLEATDLYKFSIGKFRLYIDPQSGLYMKSINYSNPVYMCIGYMHVY